MFTAIRKTNETVNFSSGTSTAGPGDVCASSGQQGHPRGRRRRYRARAAGRPSRSVTPSVFLAVSSSGRTAPALGRRSKCEWPYSYPRDAVFFSRFLFLGFRITSHSFPAGPGSGHQGASDPHGPPCRVPEVGSPSGKGRLALCVGPGGARAHHSQDQDGRPLGCL